MGKRPFVRLRNHTILAEGDFSIPILSVFGKDGAKGDVADGLRLDITAVDQIAVPGRQAVPARLQCDKETGFGIVRRKPMVIGLGGGVGERLVENETGMDASLAEGTEMSKRKSKKSCEDKMLRRGRKPRLS